ncbi:hypothetical protein C8J57DRAFT_1475042 [Mycena rebaudengoi]|nr:hypothetical protein C8J57DRAFT_1475042 [Mycena rebaudengoi]
MATHVPTRQALSPSATSAPPPLERCVLLCAASCQVSPHGAINAVHLTVTATTPPLRQGTGQRDDPAEDDGAPTPRPTLRPTPLRPARTPAMDNLGASGVAPRYAAIHPPHARSARLDEHGGCATAASSRAHRRTSSRGLQLYTKAVARSGGLRHRSPRQLLCVVRLTLGVMRPTSMPVRQGCPTVRPQSAPWQADLSNSLPGCSSYFLQQVPRIRARSIRDQQGERLRRCTGTRRCWRRGASSFGLQLRECFHTIPNGGMCGDAPVHGGYGVIRSWGAAYADVVNVESERRAGEKWVRLLLTITAAFLATLSASYAACSGSTGRARLSYAGLFWGAICFCYGVLHAFLRVGVDTEAVTSERHAGEKSIQRRQHRVRHARDPYAEPGLGYLGFFWGAIGVCCVVCTYFDMPEPQGCSFTELDLLFQHGVSVRKFTSTRTQYLPPSPNRFRSLQLPL